MITDERFVEIVRGTSLSRVQLAELLGVSLPTIRRWRSGVNLPTQTMRVGVFTQMTLNTNLIYILSLRNYAKTN